jgi:hypothetical protein
MVYSKPPFGGPEQVPAYLGRYTHRIAISNHRIVSVCGREVTFRWRDRGDGDQSKLMTLDALAFLRRFLLHVVPGGFMRIRHYGLLANACRRESLARCRTLLGSRPPADNAPVTGCVDATSWQQLLERLTGVDPTLGPACGEGRLVHVEDLAPIRSHWTTPGRATSP